MGRTRMLHLNESVEIVWWLNAFNDLNSDLPVSKRDQGVIKSSSNASSNIQIMYSHLLRQLLSSYDWSYVWGNLMKETLTERVIEYIAGFCFILCLPIEKRRNSKDLEIGHLLFFWWADTIRSCHPISLWLSTIFWESPCRSDMSKVIVKVTSSDRLIM